MTYYDPPSGWQYGFPRPYLPLPGESIVDTLIRDGYPPSMANSWGTYIRFWDTEPQQEDDGA